MVHGARPRLRILPVRQSNLRRIVVVHDRFYVEPVHQWLVHARNYGFRSMRSDCLDVHSIGLSTASFAERH